MTIDGKTQSSTAANPITITGFGLVFAGGNSTVKNLAIQAKSGSDITLTTKNNDLVQGCTLAVPNSGAGVTVVNSSHDTIGSTTSTTSTSTANTISGTGGGDAVFVDGNSAYTAVRGNTEYSCFYGVFLNGSTSYSDVSNNRIQSNATGIVDHGGFNGFSGNTITDNSGDGIYTNGAFANISGNTISENLQDGVELNGMRSAVSSNSIRFNSIEGILVRGSQNTINNNDLTQNYGGSVEVLGGDRNTISQNSDFRQQGYRS